MISRTPTTALNTHAPSNADAVATQLLARNGIRDARVDCIDTRVYLRGTANCYRTKQAAARSVAEALPGRAVINELRVVHEPTGDDSVSAGVASAIHRAAPDALAHVRVSVMSGDVYLRGVAPNADFRERIEAAAWESTGVMHVHNELTALDHPVNDRDLEREIGASLTRVFNVPDDSITVACSKGVVTLSGNVTSVEQRDMIEELVRWHDSVRDVTNNLRVRGRPNLS
jgi:osmotically-inducible protein OsmY